MTNEWKIIGLILILMSFGTDSHGTSQRPDKIIYQGKNYDLHSNPLEKYFEKNPDKRPKGGSSSNLLRGYIATFKIIDNDLFVVDIQTLRRKDENSESNWTSVLKEVFPDQEKVKLDWFDGLLVVPYGEMIKFVYMGYGSLYEHYIILEIGKGNLKKEKRFEGADYEKFKDRQFEEFKKTNDYKRIIETLRNEIKGDSTSIDSFLKISIIQYSSRILTDDED